MWTQLECHLGLIGSCFPAVNMVCKKFVGGGHGSEHSRGEVGNQSVGIWMNFGAPIGHVVSEELVVFSVLTVRGGAGGQAGDV